MILIISLKPLLRWRIWKPSGQEHWEKFRDEEYSIWYWYNHLQRNKIKDEPWRLLKFFVRGMYSFSQRLWSGKRNFMNQWERNSLRKTAKVRPKGSDFWITEFSKCFNPKTLFLTSDLKVSILIVRMVEIIQPDPDFHASTQRNMMILLLHI